MLLMRYILILFFFTSACAQQKECVFDEKSITEDFLKNNPEIKSYVWHNNDKIANVLMKSGEYVYIKRWACMSYGMEAKKVFIIPNTIDSEVGFWNEKILQFGKEFLDKSDYLSFESAIKSSDWSKGLEFLNIGSKFEIDIRHKTYPEFYLTVERFRDNVVINYLYYMN